MGVDLEEDLKRKMVELNLCGAESRKSPLTGYLHAHVSLPDAWDTIPLLENFCYVLALFRSRHAERIAEGKALLERLLAFEVDGNFPVYLHEYPVCKDRQMGLDILPVFHWLQKEFSGALGLALSKRIELLIYRVLSQAYKMQSERSLSREAVFRLYSYMEPQVVVKWEPQNPEEWAHGLITYQMVALEREGLEMFLHKALSLWDKDKALYLGKQDQMGQEPRVTLLDLLLGTYYSSYSVRALKFSPVHLRASLVYPFCPQKESPIPLEMLDPVPITNSISVYWGSHRFIHSLVVESKSSRMDQILAKKNEFEWLISLPEEMVSDQMEVSLFLNTEAFRLLHVRGKPATTFQLGDSLTLFLEEGKWELTMTVEKGEGRFFGHFLKGNRSSQKAKGVYMAEDWQMALRTLNRSPQCQLKVSLKMLPLADSQETPGCLLQYP